MEGNLKDWIECIDRLLVNTTVSDTSGNDGRIYRYCGKGVLKTYPNDPDFLMAERYDPKGCRSPKKIDISSFVCDGEMEFPHGTPISVGSHIYRYCGNNIIRHYTCPEVASSWDLNFQNSVGFPKVNNFIVGRPMSMRPPVESQLFIGQTVQSDLDARFFRYCGDGVLRLYLTDCILNSWDQDWRNAKVLNIDAFLQDTPMRHRGLRIGDTLRCIRVRDNSLYRYMGEDTVRRYVDDEAFKKHSEKGDDTILTVDVSVYKKGEDIEKITVMV